MSKLQSSFARRWAIPLAALPSIFACIYAFSLGPAPEKYVFDYERNTDSVEARVEILDAGGIDAWRVLAQDVKSPTFAHRQEALELLVQRKVEGTLVTLERIADSEQEPAAMRAFARTVLQRESVAAR